jgi:hypothetical protein
MDQPTATEALGPLPIADNNGELQRRSFDAFRAALPTARFLFRDEGTDDAGVDASIELLIDSRYTNLRAQVQLKGTASEENNEDGSISLAVRTATLNYLLNGPSPIFILYIFPRNELRFAWARDERRRLDQANRDWMQQETVTIRFEQPITETSLEEIHLRIRQEAQLQRRIHDQIGRAGAGERVVTSIDPQTLNNTDPDQAAQLLLTAGVTIVSAGYAEPVKHLFGLLRPSDARLPRIKLVHAYADYATGRFQLALAQLGEVELVRAELPANDQQLLTYLRDACAYQTGRIDSDEYRRRLEEQTGGLADGLNASYTISSLRVALFGQADLAAREEILSQMRTAVERVTSDVDITEAFKIHVKLILLESEGHQSLLTSLEEMHRARLRQELRQEVDIVALLKAHRNRWADWERSADAMLQEALALRNPLLVADALAVRLIIRIANLMHIRLLTPIFGVPTDLPEEIMLIPKRDAEQAMAIYSAADQLEGELRIRIALADLLALAGQREEAEEIARDVLPKAQAMGYAAIEEKAQMLLTGNTIPDFYARNAEIANTQDSDFRLAVESDEGVREFALDLLAAYDLPQERLPVLERECQSFRAIAIERLKWCQHIELIENLKHTDRKDTLYSVDPLRRCFCSLHKYESAIESTDWVSLIKAFKGAYCEGCPDRQPKSQ